MQKTYMIINNPNHKDKSRKSEKKKEAFMILKLFYLWAKMHVVIHSKPKISQ